MKKKWKMKKIKLHVKNSLSESIYKKTIRKNQLKVRFVLCKKEVDQSAWWEVTKCNWLVYAVYMYNIIVEYIKMSTTALFIPLVMYPWVYQWIGQFTSVYRVARSRVISVAMISSFKYILLINSKGLGNRQSLCRPYTKMIGWWMFNNSIIFINVIYKIGHYFHVKGLF